MGEKIIFGPEWTMTDRAVLLVIVCVYEPKKTLFIKSLDINKTLFKLISTDVSTSPRHPRAATFNSSREIEICLFVKSPLVVLTMIKNDKT